MNTDVATINQEIMGSTIGEGQFLTFELNNELYGVDILKVQEIRGWTEVTNIPNAPEFIRGVVNLRGAIVPILDMRRRFKMDELVFTHQTVVIVVNVSDRTIGMVVDGVSDVVNIPIEELRPAPD
ncbi:MAG: chemotaxis protein CheW, partial [Alphaproteobacteria bacterium]|nr:chemotaxis protein CheW [Alphaproteobacteria bacterium]